VSKICVSENCNFLLWLLLYWWCHCSQTSRKDCISATEYDVLIIKYDICTLIVSIVLICVHSLFSDLFTLFLLCNCLLFEKQRHEYKAKFCRALNGILYHVKGFSNDIVIMHLIRSYHKPILLYACECFNMTRSEISQLPVCKASSSSSSTTVGSMPVGVWRHSYYRCPPLPI